jgi:hypothetical protein
MAILAVLYGLIIPAAVAAAILLTWRRLLPGEWAKRSGASFALVAGFVAGYALLDLGEWKPRFYWHWLPYVALLTLVAGALQSLKGKWRIAGAIVALATVVFALWLLLPTWSKIVEIRTAYYAIWIPLTFGIGMLIAPLLRKPLGERFPQALPGIILAAAFFCASAVIFLSGSGKLAQIAGAAFGAMLGIGIVGCFRRDGNELSDLATPQAVLLCGLLLVAQVDSHSDVPLACYLVVPLAPLALWLVAFERVSQFSAWKRWLVLSAAPLAIMLAATIWAAAMTLGGESY